MKLMAGVVVNFCVHICTYVYIYLHGFPYSVAALHILYAYTLYRMIIIGMSYSTRVHHGSPVIANDSVPLI